MISNKKIYNYIIVTFVFVVFIIMLTALIRKTYLINKEKMETYIFLSEIVGDVKTGPYEVERIIYRNGVLNYELYRFSNDGLETKAYQKKLNNNSFKHLVAIIEKHKITEWNQLDTDYSNNSNYLCGITINYFSYFAVNKDEKLIDLKDEIWNFAIKHIEED